MAWFYAQPFFFMPGTTITLFVVGMLLVRHRVFEEPRAHMRLLAGMMIFGLVSWVADNWLLPFCFAGLVARPVADVHVSGRRAAVAHLPA